MSTNDRQSIKAGSLLPKTTEEAFNRYIDYYEQHFQGHAAEQIRLSNEAHSLRMQLQKKAPKFYEEKLPKIINQACAELGLYNTFSSTQGPEMRQKFNEVHAYFLAVLKELLKSQPSGEVTFQTEKDRYKNRSEYLKKQAVLRREIEELQATELSFNDLSDDENSKGAKLLRQIDAKEKELIKISKRIVAMDGEKLEDLVEYEFKLPKPDRRSYLAKLNSYELDKLEEYLKDFSQRDKKSKSELFVNISIISDMIARLGISNRFNQTEIRQLEKEALDLAMKFYRDQEIQWREERYKELCRSEGLRPKEGLILKGPDDVPEHVRRRLEESALEYKRKLEDKLEQYKNMVDGEKDNIGESVGDSTEDSEDARTLEEKDEDLEKFFHARVKEEPRDDYSGESSDDDVLCSCCPSANEDLDEDSDTDAELSTTETNATNASRTIPAQQPVSSSESDYELVEDGQDKNETIDEDLIRIANPPPTKRGILSSHNQPGPSTSRSATYVSASMSSDREGDRTKIPIGGQLPPLFNGINGRLPLPKLNELNSRITQANKTPNTPSITHLDANANRINKHNTEPCDDDDDSDIECLGTVEPQDKISKIVILD